MSASTSQLRNVATGKPAEKPKDLAALLALPQVQSQIKAALPRHMTAERLARIATTEMRKVPKLGQCDPMSFLGAVIQCAQLGLEPGNALGHAYILPFDKREKVGNDWKVVGTEAQVIIGYRGMIDLARRSGQIISIEARAVYEGDKFECVLGLHSRMDHTPDWQNANRAQGDKLRFVYTVAKLKDGGVQFDIMSRSEVDAIMTRSQGYKAAVSAAKRYNKAIESPWTTDYSAMALKTVVRRLFKFLPVSIEIQTAVGLDEQAESGISQQTGAIIDGEFTEVPPMDEPVVVSDHTEDFPAPTYAEILDRINKSTDADVLDLAADSIADVPDAAQRAELVRAAEAKFAALTKETT